MIQNNKIKNKNLQIALEFLIIYSFVLVIFLIIFVLIANQKSRLISIESYSSLQLIAQNIANYINYAQIAGTGFSITIPLVGNINNIPYYVSISNTGTVYAKMTINNQNISAIALSDAHNLVINGTLIASSNSNTINLYNVPVYTGKLYISNDHGAIYINQQPPITFNFPSYININNLGNISYVPSFNGKGNINETKPISFLANSLQNFTFSIWVNPFNQSGIIVNEQNISKGWAIPFISIVSDTAYVSINVPSGGNAFTGVFECLSLGNIPLHQWTNIAMTYDVAASGNYLTGYINGKQIAQVTTSGRSQLGSYYYVLGAKTFIPGEDNCGTQANYTGQMSNFQIYNASLTAYQVSQLYDEGISGIPVSSNINLWYPLQGNANDYSGNNNNGAIYGGVIFNRNLTYFLGFNIRNKTSSLVSNSLIGFISQYGKMGSNENYTSSMQNPGSVYVQYNRTIQDQVQATLFNGNSSTIKNLKLWYPLDYEYSNNITYDLSGNNNTGIASNVLWNGTISNKSSFMQAIFNGNSFVKSSQQLNINTNALSISAWVELKQNNTQNIAVISAGTNSLQLQINSAKPGIELNTKTTLGLSISDNLLYFITGVWNGFNNTISIYVNGVLNNVTSANGISLMQVTGFGIGNSTTSTASINGLISNVQIYNQSLSQTQIMQLYLNGPASIPETSHIISWIPLDGNANDYSINNFKTNAQNLGFRNLQQSFNFYKTSIAPFSVIAWGVSDTVPENDLTDLYGYHLIPYSWVVANPTRPENSIIIQTGYFPIKFLTPSSFGWSYKTSTPNNPNIKLAFPTNSTDYLNWLNIYVGPGGNAGNGINTTTNTYNDSYYTAVQYLYLNGKYLISMSSNDGQEIFYKNILNNTWNNISNGANWGPAGFSEYFKTVFFNPGIYEFAVNWINLAGGGYSNFSITKKLNSSIINYASFNGKGNINETKPLPFMAIPKQNFTFSIWVNPFNQSGIIVNQQNISKGEAAPLISIVSDTAYVSILVPSGGNAIGGVMECLSLGNIPLNQWTNIAMTYDVAASGNYLTGYINGKQIAQVTTTGRNQTASYYYLLGEDTFGGEWNCGTTANYTGLMSDFQIYNASLTAYQVSQLYDEGIPKTIITNIST